MASSSVTNSPPVRALPQVAANRARENRSRAVSSTLPEISHHNPSYRKVIDLGHLESYFKLDG